MTFQEGDIVKHDEWYSRIILVRDWCVLVGPTSRSIKTIQENNSFASDLISCISTLEKLILIERDGKPYVPENWKPKEEEGYYFPNPLVPQLYDAAAYYAKLGSHDHRRDSGLTYPYTEQGRAYAISHAKRMLEMK